MKIGQPFEVSAEIVTSRAQEAIATLQKACVLWQELARLDPTAPGFRNDLAVFYQVIGFMCEYAGLVPEALRSYEQSTALWRQLAQENPRVAHYQGALANSLTGMSQSLTLRGLATLPVTF